MRGGAVRIRNVHEKCRHMPRHRVEVRRERFGEMTKLIMDRGQWNKLGAGGGEEIRQVSR